MRANLLRAVSHDIRTPLTPLSGSASGIIDNYDALSKENILELLGRYEVRRTVAGPHGGKSALDHEDRGWNSKDP